MAIVTQAARQAASAPGSGEAPGRQPGLAQGATVLLVGCLPVLGILVIAPVLPEFQRHFAAYRGVAYLAPLMLTVPALCLVLCSPLAGRLAARFGRKRSLIGAMLVYTAAATAPLYLDELYAIIATRLVVGCAEAVLMTTTTMLVGDYFEGKVRERYLAMQIVCTSVTAVLFLLVSGLLGEAGWRVPFVTYFTALLMVPAAIALLWEPAAPVQQAGGGGLVPWRIVLPISAVTFIAGGCMNLVSVELGYLVEAAGSTSTVVKGVAAAANNAGIALGAFAMARFGDAGRMRQLAAALLAAAVAFALLALWRSVSGAVAGGAIAGVASGYYLGWLVAAVNRPLSFDNRGKAVGVWISSYFLATVLTPLATVALAGVLGGIPAAMLCFAVVLAVLAGVGPAVMRQGRGQRR